MQKYFIEIANVYSRIIKESPDNIVVNGKYLSYDTTSGAYTGLISGSGGRFVMSENIVGHVNLINFISGGEDIGQYLITNAKDDSEIKHLARERMKIRIWAEQKVFSLWSKYDPQYEMAIKNAIKAIGHDFRDYKYDNEYKSYDEMPMADEFFVSNLSDEEKDEIESAKIKQREAERMVADQMAGVQRKTIPSKDYDYSIPRRKPSWEDESKRYGL